MKQAYTDFNLFLPAASKGNQPLSSKHISSKDTETDPDRVDYGTPRLPLGTKVFKDFNGSQYKGKVVSYDEDAGFYKILYEDSDSEEMSHNELKLHLKPTTTTLFQSNA